MYINLLFSQSASSIIFLIHSKIKKAVTRLFKISLKNNYPNNFLIIIILLIHFKLTTLRHTFLSESCLNLT